MSDFDYQPLLDFATNIFGVHSLSRLYVAIGVCAVLWLFFRIFRITILAKLRRLAQKTRSDFDDTLVAAVSEIPSYFYGLVALFVGLQFLGLSPDLERVINGIFIILVVYQITRLLQKLLEYGAEKWVTRDKQGGDITALNGIRIIIRIVIWSAAILLVLSNLGFQVNTLVASLGIGGIAVAFALQNILADIFSSFSIYLDRPFEIGDFIKIGEYSGTVKKIGLKTTRIELMQGEELVISNKELTSSQIQNFKKLRKRRILFNLGVTYDTSAAKLKKIPKIIEEILKKTKLVTPDRVHFKEFGDFSLNFEVVYYLDSANYKVYMDTQQRINLVIFETFEKAKVEMAFPTQTVYIKK